MVVEVVRADVQGTELLVVDLGGEVQELGRDLGWVVGELGLSITEGGFGVGLRGWGLGGLGLEGIEWGFEG